MTVTERQQRDRAHRRQAIITAARQLAEAEGWDAVTTRRLADRIEYSQPVLYSHFAGGKGDMTLSRRSPSRDSLNCASSCETRGRPPDPP